MSEMVERVARAMYERMRAEYKIGGIIPAITCWPPWESAKEIEKETRRDQAAAAIKEMREPTEAMLEAAHRESWDRGDDTWMFQHSREWKSMIDEALK